MIKKCFSFLFLYVLLTSCAGIIPGPSRFHIWQSYSGIPQNIDKLALVIVDASIGIHALDGSRESIWSKLNSVALFIHAPTYAIVELKPGLHEFEAGLYPINSFDISQFTDETYRFRRNFKAGHIYLISAEVQKPIRVWKAKVEDITHTAEAEKWINTLRKSRFRRIPAGTKNVSFYPDADASQWQEPPAY